MNNIYLIVGKSGSGKTTITEYLENKYNLKSVKSYTTRPMRSKNEKGHIFISNQEFDNLKGIVAYTRFNSYRYCSTVEQIESNDLYVIDVDGIKTLKKNYKGNKKIKVIYINCNGFERYQRMKSRARINKQSYLQSVYTSLKRIINDIKAFKDCDRHNVHIDFAINNNSDDNVSCVAEKIYQYIISCEKEVM